MRRSSRVYQFYQIDDIYVQLIKLHIDSVFIPQNKNRIFPHITIADCQHGSKCKIHREIEHNIKSHYVAHHHHHRPTHTIYLGSIL